MLHRSIRANQLNLIGYSDAGCGTGRMGIELARRGMEIVGVDLDEVMLAQARSKAPQIDWQLADLSTITLDQPFDAIVMAGNVMIYLTPGTEAATVSNLAAHLNPGGLLVAGFRVDTADVEQVNLGGL